MTAWRSCGRSCQGWDHGTARAAGLPPPPPRPPAPVGVTSKALSHTGDARCDCVGDGGAFDGHAACAAAAVYDAAAFDAADDDARRAKAAELAACRFAFPACGGPSHPLTEDGY